MSESLRTDDTHNLVFIDEPAKRVIRCATELGELRMIARRPTPAI